MADIAAKCESCGATVLTDDTKNTYQCDFCNTYNTIKQQIPNVISTSHKITLNENSSNYSLILHSYVHEENTIKAYIALTDYTFHDAYAKLKKLPLIIATGLTKEKAMNISGRFFNAGCIFDIVPENNTSIFASTKKIQSDMDINEILKDIFLQYKTKENYNTRVGINLKKSDNKYYPKAAATFEIPYDEQIYYIKDATLFGFLKKGFAIGSLGLYYRTDDELKGFLSWEDFISVDILSSSAELSIGNLRFIIGTPLETYDLLKCLQMSIRKVLNS